MCQEEQMRIENILDTDADTIENNTRPWLATGDGSHYHNTSGVDMGSVSTTSVRLYHTMSEVGEASSTRLHPVESKHENPESGCNGGSEVDSI